MQNRRLLTAGGIIGVFVLALFMLSVPRATEVVTEETESNMATTAPVVSFQDTWKKGVHTITGSVKAPDACAAVEARALLDASSTPPAIALVLTMAPTSGICLQVPSHATFSVSVPAPKDAAIAATLNGEPVSKTP